MRLQEVRGDGECLFRSFDASLSGGGPGCNFAYFRQLCAQELTAHRDHYAPLLAGEDWDAYVAGIEDGAWGDATCIHALAQRLLLRVRVVPSWEFGVGGVGHSAATALEEVYEPWSGKVLRTIAIGYLHPNHYDPLFPSVGAADALGEAVPGNAAASDADAGDEAAIRLRVAAEEARISELENTLLDKTKGYDTASRALDVDRDTLRSLQKRMKEAPPFANMGGDPGQRVGHYCRPRLRSQKQSSPRQGAGCGRRQESQGGACDGFETRYASDSGTRGGGQAPCCARPGRGARKENLSAAASSST
jgi:hypothetical protein